MTNHPNAPSENCFDLIRTHEGKRLRAYVCPTGHVTIGYGHVIRPVQDAFVFGRGVGEIKKIIADAKQNPRKPIPLTIDDAQVESFLQADVRQVALFVRGVLPTALNQNQFDALISLIFNIGQNNYAGSTLHKRLIAVDFKGAAAEFPKWRMGTVDGIKQVVPGLVTRRAEERELFEREVA